MRPFVVLAALALAAPLAFAAAAPALDVQVAPTTIDMTLAGFVAPVTVVPVGGSVTFTNGDPFQQHHTARGDLGEFDTGHVVPGQSVTVRFNNAGAVAYHCYLHPWMNGVIVVS